MWWSLEDILPKPNPPRPTLEALRDRMAFGSTKFGAVLFLGMLVPLAAPPLGALSSLTWVTWNLLDVV